LSLRAALESPARLAAGVLAFLEQHFAAHEQPVEAQDVGRVQPAQPE
jgi:hypothetical protein